MKKRLQTLFFSVTLLMAGASCGQFNSPLSVIGTPGTIPLLNLPFQGLPTWGTNNLTLSTGFTFQISAIAIPAAPADGVVVDHSANSITILHSGRLQTRMDNINNTIVRTGDYVRAGQALSINGFFVGFVNFSVLLDGSQVCPWSFMSTTARSQLQAAAGFATGVCIM
jgi:hypothetical protein